MSAVQIPDKFSVAYEFATSH